MITLCSHCADSVPDLQAALADAGLPFRLGPCLSACARPAALSCRTAGKTAYLFADVTAADAPFVTVFHRLYAAAEDGEIADARPLGPLRHKLVARIPG